MPSASRYFSETSRMRSLSASARPTRDGSAESSAMVASPSDSDMWRILPNSNATRARKAITSPYVSGSVGATPYSMLAKAWLTRRATTAFGGGGGGEISRADEERADRAGGARRRMFDPSEDYL